MFFLKNQVSSFLQISLKTIGVSIWVLSTGLFYSSPARAQVGASPLVIETQAERGQMQAVINVINPTDAPIRVRIYTEPFIYNRNTGFESVKSIPNDLSPYIQFSPRELTIPPGMVRRVRLIARLAPNLPEGEYRTAVFSEQLSESDNGKGQKIGIITRVGTTVYVRKGNLAPKLIVDTASFDAAKNQIKLLVRNTGNASAIPGINWKLQQGEKVIRSGESVPSTIIAESDRYLSLSFSEKDQSSLIPGNYQLTGQLVWGEQNNKKTVPFSLNLTIPATTSTSK